MNYSDTARTAPSISHHQDTLLQSLLWMCEYHGHSTSARAFCAGLPKVEKITTSVSLDALKRQGLTAGLVKRAASELSPFVLPAILIRHEGGGMVLLNALTGESGEPVYQVILPETGNGVAELTAEQIATEYSGYTLLIKENAQIDRRTDIPETRPGGHWLWHTLWRYRRYYVSAGLAAMLVNILALASTFFTMNVYDRVVPNEAYVTLWTLAFGVTLAIVMEFLGRNIRAYLIDVAGKKADLVIGSHLFRHALSIRMEHKPRSAGAFANQLREYESVRDFVSSATLVTISDLPFVLCFVFIISLIGGPLAWVSLAAIPVIIAVSLAIQWPLSKIMRENLREGSVKQSVLIESVEGLETLKATGGEGFMQQRWEMSSAQMSASSMKSKFLSGIATNCVGTLQQIQTVAIVIWGVYLIGEGSLSMGALIGTVILSGRVVAPLGQVVGLAVRFQQARAAMKAINGLMALPAERDPTRHYLAAPDLRGELALEKVSFTYPGPQGLPASPVIIDVSVKVKPGERIAVLGRIGSGKSTLLRMMAGLFQPTQGQVLMDDIDSLQINPADWRDVVGFVGQDSQLFHGSLRENVLIGQPDCSTDAFLEVARMTGLDQMAKRHPLGFDMPIGERGQGLSGGQQQLVALARCLLAKPRLLLMDEPTSAMDTQTESLFLARLWAATQNQTMVIVTHRYSLLEQVDRIIVMDAGKVAMDGPKVQVLAALSGKSKSAAEAKVPTPTEVFAARQAASGSIGQQENKA